MNLADLLEALADAVGARDAVIQGGRRLSWSELDRRAWGVATALVDAGLGRGARVALYLRNCPEYLEGHVGALKASLVPVNTNYRYVDDELVHLWNDADAAAVIFHGAFADVVERIRGRVPLVRSWLWVDDDSGPCPTWARPYEDAICTPRFEPPWPRSYDDLVFIYTGGTTGLPKGVMWDQDLYLRRFARETGDLGSLAARRVAAMQRKALPAAPLMHGTGSATAIGTLMEAGTVVLLPSARFDAAELWNEVERHGVGSVTIVGDAFARPMVDALDAEPDRWDLGGLRRVVSAGAMFSAPVKARLLDHLPHLVLRDQLGSSENALSGMRVHRGAADGTATFDLAPGVRVLDDDGHDVEAGSGQVGVLAAPGGAVGYHKDPEKTARTWKVIDGQRYTVAGDYATVDADGTLRLLGRGRLHQHRR
ncbi:MAG: AMP-binding protein [Acidimicrobiia bacterium]|nr:AMP-binding protein [Acidimicrobiia bacterium]